MSAQSFQIVQVSAERSIRDEALGTKNKFWVELDGDEQQWLFKEARPGTGEDWSEKLAAEIAALIGIRAAKVELAVCDERRGTVSRSFVDREAGEDLIHGNEILAGQVLGYDPEKKFGQSDHTLQNIRRAISTTFRSEPAICDGILTELASYMVLDGLIGNVDRHHENWGLLGSYDDKKGGIFAFRVAPSFDHASSMGRLLQDTKIERLLASPDGAANYVAKGRGAIYISAESKHGANPLRLVEFGSRQFPEYFGSPLAKVKDVNLNQILELVDKVPEDRISPSAREFVKQFLSHTYGRLCKLTT